jgi:hypothetical protein
VEVDLMPSIGEETYADADNRVPTRDQRGTPEQDTLRRDLAIGAMYIEVGRWARMRPSVEPSGVDSTSKSPSAGLRSYSRPEPGGPGQVTMGTERALRYRLLDYCGGLPDLRAGVLRAPFPADARFAEADRALATAAGLGLDDAQAAWWAKTLRDDPVRPPPPFSTTVTTRVHSPQHSALASRRPAASA